MFSSPQTSLFVENQTSWRNAHATRWYLQRPSHFPISKGPSKCGSARPGQPAQGGVGIVSRTIVDLATESTPGPRLLWEFCEKLLFLFGSRIRLGGDKSSIWRNICVARGLQGTASEALISIVARRQRLYQCAALLSVYLLLLPSVHPSIFPGAAVEAKVITRFIPLPTVIRLF